MSEDRSDTESPVGPVPGEPLHGYVNLPQNERHEDDQDGDESDPTNNSLPPPLLAKKDRSRCEIEYLLNLSVCSCLFWYRRFEFLNKYLQRILGNLYINL